MHVDETLRGPEAYAATHHNATNMANSQVPTGLSCAPVAHLAAIYPLVLSFLLLGKLKLLQHDFHSSPPPHTRSSYLMHLPDPSSSGLSSPLSLISPDVRAWVFLH